MNFEDLLDEDGQGTRRCDAWLAENIGEWKIERDYYDEETDREYYWYVHNPNTEVDTFANRNINEVLNEENLPRYTTGDSIDPIWELAKEYLNQPELVMISEESYFTKAFPISSHTQNTEQLAIAEALFKAYQKEDNQ